MITAFRACQQVGEGNGLKAICMSLIIAIQQADNRQTGYTDRQRTAYNRQI